jgi:peroxiredoxin
MSKRLAGRLGFAGKPESLILPWLKILGQVSLRKRAQGSAASNPHSLSCRASAGEIRAGGLKEPGTEMLGIRNYNYKHFTRSILRELESSDFGGPSPGDPAPDFTGTTLAGEKIRLSSFQGHRNVLLVFGSATCPLTAGSIQGISGLYEKLNPDQVEVLFVYVREAHPGERIPAHHSQSDKAHAARLLCEEEDMEMTVVVDDVKGSIHHKYSSQPNPSFLIDKSGRIAFRSRRANPQALGAAIEELVERQRQWGTDHVVVGGGEDLSEPVSYDQLHSFRAVERGGENSVSDFNAVFGRSFRAALVDSVFAHPGRMLAVAALTTAALAGGLYAGFELRKRRLGSRRNPYRAYEKQERDTDTGTDYGAVGI